MHHLGQLVLLTPCSHRQNAEVEDQVTLTVIHTNGIHSVTFIRCRCATCPSVTKAQLLLRHRLWPGSVVNPETAITFDALDTFQKLSLQGKISVYDYVETLQQMTDNVTSNPTEVPPPPAVTAADHSRALT